MKTNVQISSIECFYGSVQSKAEKQHARILSVMVPGVEYTGQQLFKMTGYTPNVISARMSELRKKGKVVRSRERIECPISEEKVFTHRLKNFADDLVKTSSANNDSADILQVALDFSQKEAA